MVVQKGSIDILSKLLEVYLLLLMYLISTGWKHSPQLCILSIGCQYLGFLNLLGNYYFTQPQITPDYSRLKVFGCSCFPWLKRYVHSKLDPKRKFCIFLGYSLQHKGYRCLDPQTGRVYISRHVHFDETVYPFHSFSPVVVAVQDSSSPSMDLHFSIPISRISSESPSSSLIIGAAQNHDSSGSASHSDPTSASHNSESLSIPPGNIHPMITPSKAGIYKPKVYLATKHPLPLDIDVVPTTYLQASKHVHWGSAMQDEFSALQSTGTWTLVPPSPAQNVVVANGFLELRKS